MAELGWRHGEVGLEVFFQEMVRLLSPQESRKQGPGRTGLEEVIHLGNVSNGRQIEGDWREYDIPKTTPEKLRKPKSSTTCPGPGTPSHYPTLH